MIRNVLRIAGELGRLALARARARQCPSHLIAPHVAERLRMATVRCDRIDGHHGNHRTHVGMGPTSVCVEW